MATQQDANIQPVLDKHLLHTTSPDRISLCPVLDLVAIVTSTNVVEVFRFTGHRAFGTRGPEDAHVEALAWKPDGSQLKVFWRGGDSCVLLSNMTTFTSTRVDLNYNGGNGDDDDDDDEDESKVKTSLSSCLWKSQEAHLLSTTGFKTDGSWSDLGLELFDDKVDEGISLKSGNKESITALAAFLDSVQPLKELPPLGDIISMRDPTLWRKLGLRRLNISLHQALNACSDRGDASGALDMILLAEKGNAALEGTVGSFPLSQHFSSFAAGTGIEFIATYAQSYCTAVLTRPPTPDIPRELRLVSFNAFPQNGRHLRSVGKSVHTLQSLITYIIRCIDCMRIFWKAGRRAFEHQIANIEEDLSKLNQDGLNLPTSLYQLALTGDCAPQVKTWISEDMGAQGITRWYTALGASLQQLLSICQKSLLPAIEHASTAASHLHALTAYDVPICAIDPKMLTALSDDLAILHLTASSLLDYIVAEAHSTYLFTDFLLSYSSLLADPTSTAAKEAETRIAEADYPPILEYIQHNITRNPLDIFLGRSTEQILQAQRRPKQYPMRRAVEMMIKRHAEVMMVPSSSPVVELVNMLYLGMFVDDSTARLVEGYGEAFAKATVVSAGYPLDPPTVPQEIEWKDLVMLPSAHGRGELNTCALSTGTIGEEKLITIHTLNHPPTLEASDNLSEGSTRHIISLKQTGYKLLDAKFSCSTVTGNKKILLLLTYENMSTVSWVDVSSDASTTTPHRRQDQRTELSEGDLHANTVLTVDHAVGFRPRYLMVAPTIDEETGDKVQKERVVLLDESGRGVRIYDL